MEIPAANDNHLNAPELPGQDPAKLADERKIVLDKLAIARLEVQKLEYLLATYD